jgi:hypothetical protein
MAQQTIGIGAAPNDDTGDTLRDAFDKTNDNFTEVYTALDTKAKSSSHSVLTYAASVALDLDPTLDDFRTLTLAGNITFTTTNLAAARSKTIRIIGDGTERTFTFPAWKFVGTAAPTTIAVNKTAILTITSFGTTDANVIAAYAVEP